MSMPLQSDAQMDEDNHCGMGSFARAGFVALITLAGCAGDRLQADDPIEEAVAFTMPSTAATTTTSDAPVNVANTESFTGVTSIAQRTPTTVAASTAAETAQPPQAVEMVLNGSFVFYHIGEMAPGFSPILTTQPNGQPLEVPRLDPSTPELLTRTALNLIACYVTMGDPECRAALTIAPEEIAQLDFMRQELNVVADATNQPQLAIFSNPANPAQFTATTESRITTIVFSGGELYFERLVDNFYENEWQGPWTREYASMGGRDLVATEFRMNFRQEDEDGLSDTGVPILTGFEYSLNPAR